MLSSSSSRQSSVVSSALSSHSSSISSSSESSSSESSSSESSSSAESSSSHIHHREHSHHQLVDDITIATSQRNITAAGDVSFSANSYASSDSEAKASAGGAEPPEPGDEEQTSEDQINTQLDSVDTPNKEEHKNAITGKTRTTEGEVSIAAALALNLANSRAIATLGDSIVINAQGQLKLATSNETDASAVADGSAVGQSAGIGVAVALNIVDITNQASIGSSNNITASGMTLQAKMSDDTLGGDGTSDFTAKATAGAGGTKVGVAGSFALNYMGTNASSADIQSGAVINVNGGDITLVAENNTKTITEAKAAQEGSGKLGIGASFAIDIENNIASASIEDNVTLSPIGKLTLTATSENSSATTSAAGSAGNIAISPTIATTIVTNTTEASIGSGGTLTVGSIAAIATHSGSSTTITDATAGGSSVGVGVSIALNIIEDNTIAYTERSITGSGDITFAAYGYALTGATAKASASGGKAAEEGEQEQTSEDQVNNQIDSTNTTEEQKQKNKGKGTNQTIS